MSTKKWILIIEKGCNLIAKDSNGKSDPFVNIELVTATNVNGTWKNIKTSCKTKTPTKKKTLNPEWNYKALSVDAKGTWENYNGIKLTCFDKDSLSDDFMGQSYLWFNEDIPYNEDKDITVLLSKKNMVLDPKLGKLAISSKFIDPARRVQRRVSVPVVNKSLSNIESTVRAISKSDLVQVSSTGRREVKIQTSGVKKYISYGELPSLNNVIIDEKHKTYGFHATTALWLITCCSLAYKPEEIVQTVCCNVWDMFGYKFFNNKQTDTQGFGIYNDKILIICFRGTESVRDWITNLNFVQTVPTVLPKRYAKSGVKVHQGFNSALESVWPDVLNFIDKAFNLYPDLKLYICGHSLGGALANLCFGYVVLSDNPRPVEGIYTVGQPRAGNKFYKEQLEIAAPNTPYIRITNNQDCVPSLAGGQHCGVHVHFDSKQHINFNATTLTKAVVKMRSIKGSVTNLNYAGLSDHGTPSYLRLIEGYWIKSEYAHQSNNSGSFSSCELISYLIDVLQEDIKGLVRHKVQFRLLVAEIIKVKPFIKMIEDMLASGIGPIASSKLNELLLKFIKFLTKTKTYILKRHTKVSGFASLGQKTSTMVCNHKLSKLAERYQQTIDELHNTLSLIQLTPHHYNHCCEWVEEPKIVDYDPSIYNNIHFSELKFHQFETINPKQEVTHATLVLETVEMFVEKGDLESAKKTLEKLKDSNVIGTLSPEDEAMKRFIEAKIFAKLEQHEEVLKVLQSISESGYVEDVTKDKAFNALEDSNEFIDLRSNWGSINTAKYNTSIISKDITSQLNNFEIHLLSSIFDEGDVNADAFLTINEFSDLIESNGGIIPILQSLGWIDESILQDDTTEDYKNLIQEKKDKLDIIHNEIEQSYGSAVTLDQFIQIMSKLAPQ